MKGRLQEQQIPLPDDIEDVLSIVRQGLLHPDFHSIHIEMGKPIALKRLADPNDILEGVVQEPAELLRRIQLSLVELPPSFSGPEQLVYLQSCVLSARMSCVALIVSSLSFFSRWIGIPVELLKTKPWSSDEADFRFMSLAGYEDLSLEEGTIAMLAGETEAMTTINVKSAFYAHVEKVSHGRANTSGWNFQ